MSDVLRVTAGDSAFREAISAEFRFPRPSTRRRRGAVADRVVLVSCRPRSRRHRPDRFEPRSTRTQIGAPIRRRPSASPGAPPPFEFRLLRAPRLLGVRTREVKVEEPYDPTKTDEAVDGIRRWKQAIRVGGGRRAARIVFRNPTRPRSLAISGWRRLDSDGEPVGRAQRFDYELSPRRRGGKVVGWRASFSFRLRAGRYLYFDVFGRWPDRQGCGGSQDASWTFHVKTHGRR
jgi:hypothetical protein